MAVPLLLLCACASIPQVTVTTVIALDCGTTLLVLGQGNSRERNPFLGVHPSPAKVLGLCAIGAVANLKLPPKKVRKVWWAILTAIEAYEVVHNLKEAQ